MTPLYIVETIHTLAGQAITTRYPTLFFPEEAMDERTIRIFAGLQKPFGKMAAVDYVLYHLEAHDDAGQWRMRRHDSLVKWEPRCLPASTGEQQTSYRAVPNSRMLRF